MKDDEIDRYQRGGETTDRLEGHYDEHRSYHKDYDSTPPTQDELINELLDKHKTIQMGVAIEKIIARVDSSARKRERALGEGQLKIMNLVQELKDMDEDNFSPLHLSDKNKKFYFEELNELSLPVYLDLKSAIVPYLNR